MGNDSNLPTSLIWAEAKRLYDANDNRASCPQWDILGDVTRSVWFERAQTSLYGASKIDPLPYPRPSPENAP